MEMYRFYTEILKINNRELQTMKWSEIVNRLLALHDGSSAGQLQVIIVAESLFLLMLSQLPSRFRSTNRRYHRSILLFVSCARTTIS